MKNKIKYIIIGLIIGFVVNNAFFTNINAEYKFNQADYTEAGTVSWKPLYVKIVN